MLVFPQIDPVALQLGPIQIYWYGLCYVVSFILGWRWLLAQKKLSHTECSELLFYVGIGVILGGRLGYALLYGFPWWKNDILWIFKIWQGGMSFHGGLVGVLLAVWLFGRHFHKSFLSMTDLIAPFIPVGIFFGRIGNFIGGQLWGRPTDMPWGMVFPHVDSIPRHPSQLYEAGLEGIVLGIGLWFYTRHPRAEGRVSAWFAMGYAILRIIGECFREPDFQHGFVGLPGMTLGQWFSLPLLGVGIWLWRRSRHAKLS